MLSFLVKASLRCLVLAAVLYGAVFVKVGQRSLYDHLARIVMTEPAQELWGEVGGAFDRAVGAVEGQLANATAERAPAH